MKRTSRIIALFLLSICLLCAPALALTELDTTSGLSEGMSRVAVEGRFNGDAQTALDRINAIRLEACKEGVENPAKPGTALTEADYKPMQWSASLEYIARVRAAESSLVTSHTRPNGKSCFSASAPDGIRSYAENLAWNWNSTIVSGVQQWYKEKSDWVGKTGGVTGHYTSMINPNYRYVGLSSFTNSDGVYRNTVSGEFDGYQTHSSSAFAPVQDCRVFLEIASNALGSPSVVKKDVSVKQAGKLDKGDVVAFSLTYPTNLEGDKAQVLDAGQVTWSSSDSSVVTITSEGIATINGSGSAIIKAVSTSGKSASYTVNVKAGSGATSEPGTGDTKEPGTGDTKEPGSGDAKEPGNGATSEQEYMLILSKTSVKVNKTKKTTVDAEIADGDSIQASSSNTKIAAVAVSGRTITVKAGKKAGKATVTVSTASGLSQSFQVVVPKVKTKKLSCKAIKVKVGKKATLKPKVTPAYSDDTLKFKSSNKKVAVVNKKGVVTGKKKGTAIVTITSGKKSVKVKVKVK